MRVKQKRKPKTPEQKIKENLRKLRQYHEFRKFDLKYKAKVTQATRNWQLNNPEKYMWGRSRQAAIKLGLEFNIEVSDIKIPEMCPIMNEPMIPNTRYAPSIDRIDSTKGYIKGNIWVISRKANTMKNDASKEELILFARWVREYIE